MIYSSQQCSHGFEGELIENKLYQSADDVVDCHRDHDDTQSSVKGSTTEPYYKNLQTKLESDEDPYSYASHFWRNSKEQQVGTHYHGKYELKN